MNSRRLALGGHLDRYVASLFAASWATSFLVVVGLFLIMDFAQNFDDFLEVWPDGTQPGTDLVATYYLLNIPSLFLQCAPFVCFTAGLFTLGRLAKHNEVQAALAAGLDARRVLLPIFIGGVISMLLMICVRELSSSGLARERDGIAWVLRNQQSDLVYEDLYVRDVGGGILRLKEFRPANEEAKPEVRGLDATFKREGKWISVVADRMIYEDRAGETAWWLEAGERYEVGGEEKRTSIDRLMSFDFEPDLPLSYQRARENPLDLSIAETLILAERDPENVVYQTLLHYHLTFPLACIILLLVGLPFQLRLDRGGGADGLIRGLLLCVFYFAADFACRNFGLQGTLDPLLASWLPLLAFGSLGVALYDGIQT
jgi:lipopolysaccharide export system permease protein